MLQESIWIMEQSVFLNIDMVNQVPLTFCNI